MKLYQKIIGLTLATIVVAMPIMASDYDNHWAKQAIDKWIEKGVINGFEDGTFRPNEAITKAQFAKIMSELLGYTESDMTDGATQYADIKDTDWYSPYIKHISANKIMHEEGPLFNPNAPMTREEAAYALMNAFKLQDSTGNTPHFSDADQIADWANEAITTLYNLDYMKGLTPDTISPKGQLTRAEFVVLIERLDATGKIKSAETEPPTSATSETPMTTTTISTPSTTTTPAPSTNPTVTIDETTFEVPTNPNTANTLVGGTISLVDSNGKFVDFPKNYMIQLEMYLTNDQRVLSHNDFNYDHTGSVHNYEIKETSPLSFGQTYIIKAFIRNDDNHNETYYLEQPVSWTNELKSLDLVLKAEFDAHTTDTEPDKSTPIQPEESTPTQPEESVPVEPTLEEIPPQEEQPIINQDVDERTAFENQVLVLVNMERENAGLVPLTMNETLREAARYKSDEMQSLDYFNHDSPTYGSSVDLVNMFGVNWLTTGENIAKGQATPERVVEGWMNSEHHRDNILNGNFTEMGVGFNAEGKYWTQIFVG